MGLTEPGGEAVQELEEQSMATGGGSVGTSEGKGKEGGEKSMKRKVLRAVSNELS